MDVPPPPDAGAPILELTDDGALRVGNAEFTSLVDIGAAGVDPLPIINDPYGNLALPGLKRSALAHVQFLAVDNSVMYCDGNGLHRFRTLVVDGALSGGDINSLIDDILNRIAST